MRVSDHTFTAPYQRTDYAAPLPDWFEPQCSTCLADWVECECGVLTYETEEETH